VNVVLPVKNYGGGHQHLIEIGKALNKNARLLILDEPSASLTAAEIEVLLENIRALKARGVACVYISHKLEEVAAICDTIVVIRDGKHIATTPMQQMNVDRIIAQMCGRELNQLYPSMPHEVGEVVMEARHVTCWDPDQPQRKKVDDVSFQVRRGEILGIAGLVGAGRTELVTAIFGSYPGRYEAEVWLEGERVDTATPLKAIEAGFALVPEDRKQHGIVRDLSVGENITLSVLDRYSKLSRIDGNLEAREVGEQIRRLALKTASPALPITALSGGNQQKAVLAKMLLTGPRVLILDEPTRGVDVGAKFEIYKLMLELAAQGIAIVMVSSELAEVLGVSDRVLVMGEGRLRGEFVNQGLTQEMVLAAAIGQGNQNG
jgi:D-xylose transport system ATP-binding protein